MKSSPLLLPLLLQAAARLLQAPLPHPLTSLLLAAVQEPQQAWRAVSVRRQSSGQSRRSAESRRCSAVLDVFPACVPLLLSVLQYRVCQEGIDAIYPYMSRQLLRPTFADLLALLLKGSLLLKHLAGRRDAFAQSLRQEGGQLQDGCVVLLMDGSEDERIAALTAGTLALAAWKTQHSLALMIPQQERSSLINLLTHRHQHDNGEQQLHSGQGEQAEAASGQEARRAEAALSSSAREAD